MATSLRSAVRNVGPARGRDRHCDRAVAPESTRPYTVPTYLGLCAGGVLCVIGAVPPKGTASCVFRARVCLCLDEVAVWRV